MDIEELRELFRQLIAQGITPMLCDTEVPKYDTSVPCGEPTPCYEDGVETILLPKELLSMHPEFLIPVRGDSMKGVGIVTGDVVKVTGDITPNDGDIVLATIDGEYTLKTYCTDEDGLHWLVPQNDAYEPILLDGQRKVRIYGRVKEIVKTAPRVGFNACMKVIRKAKEQLPKVPTRQQVEPTEDRPAVETEEAGCLADNKSSIGSCFRHVNDFVREKVAGLVRDYYHGNYAELALIEVTLYDHGQLKKRNLHRALLNTLAAWGLITIADDAELKKMTNSMAYKMGQLPKEGYKEWTNDYQNDRETCKKMGRILGDTMTYSR